MCLTGEYLLLASEMLSKEEEVKWREEGELKEMI